MRVREAAFSDIPAMTETMVQSFRSAFSGFVSPETMAANTREENCLQLLKQCYNGGTMRFLIADEGGMLIWQPAENGAEIVALHTRPHTLGTGLGKALLDAALAQIGNRPVFLWAFRENHRALRFYEKNGLVPNGSSRVSEFDGAVEIMLTRSQNL